MNNEELLFQTLVKDAALKIMQGQNPKATFEFLRTYVDKHKRKSSDELKQIISGGWRNWLAKKFSLNAIDYLLSFSYIKTAIVDILIVKTALVTTIHQREQ